MEDEKALIKYAPFWRRALAALIDGFILLTINLSIFASLGNMGKSMGSFCLFISINYAYEILLIFLNNGMTVGKKFLEIRVISTRKGNITLYQSFLRAFSKILSRVILFIGYIWIIFNKKNQTWHDMISETIVIYKGDEEEIKENINRNSWKGLNKYIKFGAIGLTVIISIFLFLNQAINETKMFGMKKIDTKHVDGIIKDVEFFDIDKDGVKELILFSIKGRKRLVRSFKWENNELIEDQSFEIERIEGESTKNIRQEDTLITYLNNSKNFNIIMAESYDGVYKLKVYENRDGVLRTLDVKELKNDYTYDTFSDVKMIEDKEGTRSIVWNYQIYDENIVEVYKWHKDKLLLEYKKEFPHGKLVEGDFIGKGYENHYFLSKQGEDINIEKLKYENNTINILGGWKIKGNSTLESSFRNSRQVKVGDIDRDGKDEIIFLAYLNEDRAPFFIDKSAFNNEPWLKIYSLKDDKWIKLWDGGVFRQIKSYRDEYQGIIDINQDGKDEIIITHNHMHDRISNYIIGYGDNNKGQIYFYHIQPLKFKLNKVFQEIHKMPFFLF